MRRRRRARCGDCSESDPRTWPRGPRKVGARLPRRSRRDGVSPTGAPHQRARTYPRWMAVRQAAFSSRRIHHRSRRIHHRSRRTHHRSHRTHHRTRHSRRRSRHSHHRSRRIRHTRTRRSRRSRRTRGRRGCRSPRRSRRSRRTRTPDSTPPVSSVFCSLVVCSSTFCSSTAAWHDSSSVAVTSASDALPHPARGSRCPRTSPRLRGPSPRRCSSSGSLFVSLVV